ncbi:hypothetical protein [Cysteiniphilum halobium]|uniref:hypothetical protein n=1 Tax=Cysteiniphilum halobium TaxID=2219059 RepID=UPI003F8522DE
MGILYVYLYIASFVVSQILVYKLGQNYNAFFVLFFNCTIAIVFFNFFEMCRGQLIENFRIAFMSRGKELFMMSAHVSLMWIFSYASTIESSARFGITIDFLAAFTFINLTYRKYSFLNLISSLVSILTIILCIIFIPEHSVLGTIYGVLTGVFTALYRVSSFDFSKKYKFSSVAILSVRLFFLWSASLILWLISDHHILSTFVSLNSNRILIIFILMAVLGMILPSFFGQIALQKLKPYLYSRFVTTVPVVVLLLQGLIIGDWSITVSFICLLATIILNLESLLSKRS